MAALIFFDIDGTLCPEGASEMPESTRNALHAAQKNGHKIFINSGRTPALLDPFLQDVGFDGFVMSCGAYIRVGDTLFDEAEFSHEESLRIRNTFHDAGIVAYYEGNNAIWFEEELIRDNAMAAQFFNLIATRGKARVIDPADPTFRFVKVLALTPDAEKIHAVNASLGQLFDPIYRGGPEYAWELATNGYSKATGIEWVRKLYGASLDDCYAIGDSSNDLPMLQHVPNSIAVGNATEEVKKACAYVTTAQDEDGIRNALQHFGLI